MEIFSLAHYIYMIKNYFIKNSHFFAATILSPEHLNFKGSFTVSKALFIKAALQKLCYFIK